MWHGGFLSVFISFRAYTSEFADLTPFSFAAYLYTLSPLPFFEFPRNHRIYESDYFTPMHW